MTDQKNNEKKVSEHPFFGMFSDSKETVSEQMDRLRGSRVNAPSNPNH